MRYELPPGLTPEEERTVVSALHEYLGSLAVRPSPWALAGRAEACGIGALQIRYQSMRPWNEIRLYPYTRLGTSMLRGRGDAK